MCCEFKYRSSDSAHGIFFTGGDGRWLLTGAHSLVQNIGKRTLFPQNWSDNDAKKYELQDFYNIFDLHVWETRWPKQVQQISWNALLKYILELVACNIHHADKYWIIVGQKVKGKGPVIIYQEEGGGGWAILVCVCVCVGGVMKNIISQMGVKLSFMNP